MIDRNERGQSLVELAIVMPLLLLIFLGVIEIGWFLAVHLNLLQFSREAARFGVREGVMNFSTPETTEAGYDQISAHLREIVRASIMSDTLIFGGQVTPTAAVVFSRYDVQAAVPCTANPCPVACSKVTPDMWYQQDDQIITWLEKPAFIRRYGLTVEDQVDPVAISNRMLADNVRLNCEREKRGDVFGWSDQAFLVEIYYDQPQLFDFPLFSWVGPFPHHVSTQMRFSRQQGVVE